MTIETTSPSSKIKRIILFIILGFLLLLMLWLGLKTWRIYQAGQALLDRKAEIETLMADGLTNIEPDKAESLVMDTRENIQTLKEETAVFMPLTPYLGWVPKVGSTLVIAPSLMRMGEAGIDSAAYAVRGLKPALAIMQEGSTGASMLSQLSGVLVDAGPDLAAANEKLTEVAAARAEISNIEKLPGQLQTLFTLSDELLPFAQDGLTLTAVLPEILGENGPRTYLIVAQNEDELRPTGGFISAAGTLVVENGDIVSLEMADAYSIDNWRDKPYDFPPQPFYDYMGLDLFFFRDTNFWPDFPTSAEKAMDLYSYGQDQPPLDGIIAIDQEFIRLLVEATGSLTVPESSITISPQNAIEALQNAWGERKSDDNSEWIINRKAFIGLLAAALIDHIQNNFAAVDPIALAQNMKTAVAGKHLQIYLRDAHAQATLDQINWDGRLENPNAQDFLAVVDTNMGFTKANLNIERTFAYQVSLHEDGTGEAHLNIVYTHTSQTTSADCISYEFKDYEEDTQYLDLTEKCYWNYLRIYVPEGSQLLSATEHHVPGESMRSGDPVNSTANTFTEQTDFTTFANFLLVPIGQQTNSDYHYLLPKVIISDENEANQYQLTLRKQAGSQPESTSVSITLPDGATLITSNPLPSAINENTISFDITLDTDKIITLTYD